MARAAASHPSNTWPLWNVPGDTTRAIALGCSTPCCRCVAISHSAARIARSATSGRLSSGAASYSTAMMCPLLSGCIGCQPVPPKSSLHATL